jgi:hypothetical protein
MGETKHCYAKKTESTWKTQVSKSTSLPCDIMPCETKRNLIELLAFIQKLVEKMKKISEEKKKQPIYGCKMLADWVFLFF